MKTRIVLMFDDLEFARLAGSASGANLSIQEFIKRELNLKGDDIAPSGSVQCPVCRWGFAPAVIKQHLREKHSVGAS